MRRIAWTTLGLALCACSHVEIPMAGHFPDGGGKLKDQPKEPSPEENPKAPGQIPQECEALLVRSHDWGFNPEVPHWKPKSREDALAASEFFSVFHLVPESTSKFATAWMKEARPLSAAAAKKSVDRMDRAQSCDMVLAHALLLSLVDYRWKKADRPIVARDLTGFLKLQQDRVAPSMARAVQISVLIKAVKKRLVKGHLSKIVALQKWFDEETTKGLSRADVVEDSFDKWKLGQDELRISEETRARLDRVLP